MLPTALSIAGLDPSGGAGIAADLRSFAAAEAWGAAVAACLTVQSTRGVVRVVPVAAPLLVDQAEEVLADSAVRAIKVGAVGSEANAHAVARILEDHPKVPSVVDPVMIPTRTKGATLHGRGLAALRGLLRVATLLTPNRREASALIERPIESEVDAREAAMALVAEGARAVLVKGGHGDGPQAIDWLALPDRVVRIARKRRVVPEIHGLGCTLSSLIAGRLATTCDKGPPRPEALVEVVRWARGRLDRALAHPLEVGGGLHVVDVRRGRLP